MYEEYKGLDLAFDDLWTYNQELEQEDNRLRTAYSDLKSENKRLMKLLYAIQSESCCDGAGRTLTRINDFANEAINPKESEPERIN